MQAAPTSPAGSGQSPGNVTGTRSLRIMDTVPTGWTRLSRRPFPHLTTRTSLRHTQCLTSSCCFIQHKLPLDAERKAAPRCSLFS